MKKVITAVSAFAAIANLSAYANTPANAQAAASVSTAATCAATSTQEIAGLFDRWNTSLATLSPDKVVANYAQDGVLLPTVSNKPRTNHAEMRDYFVKFLAAKPQGVINTRTIKIGCNLAQDIGTYTFTFGDGKKVAARYTYVYERQGNQWLIAHHHSSAMPE